MLWVGLTGGIGAGKSAVSDRLAAGGAALVDADRVAREVVEPGTPGLAAVVEAFGREVLTETGALDREALGRRVFADDEARRRLNGIVHPLIGERTVALAAEAERSGARVLVHDVPLLVEGGLAPGYHLVVVVEAPLELRLHRLTALRGMPADDARARMAAQADDDARRAVADVLLVNDGPLERLHAEGDRLLVERLVPYAENLVAGRCAGGGAGSGPAPDPEHVGRRVVERVRSVCGERATAVEVVGSADGAVALEVRCPSTADADAVAPALAAAGFPETAERRHCSADPGRPVDLRVRVAG